LVRAPDLREDEVADKLLEANSTGLERLPVDAPWRLGGEGQGHAHTEAYEGGRE